MFDGLYPEQADTALNAKAMRPPEPEPNARKFSVWSMLGAAPKGTAAGSAQALASTADVTKATTEHGLQNITGPLGRIPVFNAIQSLVQVGQDVLNPKEGQFTSEVGTSLRNVAQDYTPDAQTAHVAESAVFNLFRVGSKAITAAATMGNVPGAFVAGMEEGFSTADDLARQGVDIKTRTKVGAVTGATNAVGFALPAAGKTWLQTGALALAGGPVSFVAQNAATREILQDADYSKLADQYDPLDPVGLALSTLVPLGFGALAMRGAKVKGAAPDAPAKGAQNMSPPDDIVDAARVTLVRQQMDAANPVPDSIEAADAHVKAYTTAMDQMAAGERVQVADVAPARIQIEPAQRDANFKAWFGDSKVVDESGAPMVVYHGTAQSFDVFDTGKRGTGIGDEAGQEGFFFTTSPGNASHYAGEVVFGRGDGAADYAAGVRGQVMAVYLRAENPLTVERGQSNNVEVIKAAKAAGHDAIIDPRGDIVVFDRKQIKSAIGNSGKFDPNSGSLTDNPIADWGANLKKSLDDMAAEVQKNQPKPASAPADTAQAATKTVASTSSFNPAALANEATSILSGGKTAAQAIGEIEATGAKVSPELQNMLIGASEFGGRMNDLVDQVKVLQAQRGANAQGFDLIAEAVENLRSGRTVEAKAPTDPLEKALADMAVRNPTALDAEIPIDFDADGKPGTRMTVRDYLDMVKREASQDAADADLIEVAATCFLSGGV